MFIPQIPYIIAQRECVLEFEQQLKERDMEIERLKYYAKSALWEMIGLELIKARAEGRKIGLEEARIAYNSHLPSNFYENEITIHCSGCGLDFSDLAHLKFGESREDRI